MTPDSLPDPLLVAGLVATALERIGAVHVIGGSFASSFYGEPRSTNDIDVVADLSLDAARALAEALGPQFYMSATAAAEAVRSGGSFNIIDVRSAVKVDVFVAGEDALDRDRLRRRQRVQVTTSDGSIDLFVDTPEAVVLRKLEWFRRGGETSERQWRDVVGVLRAQAGRLDRDYLTEWADRVGVADLLRVAEEEAARG